jgi:hypothetical protein
VQRDAQPEADEHAAGEEDGERGRKDARDRARRVDQRRQLELVEPADLGVADQDDGKRRHHPAKQRQRRNVAQLDLRERRAKRGGGDLGRAQDPRHRAHRANVVSEEAAAERGHDKRRQPRRQPGRARRHEGVVWRLGLRAGERTSTHRACAARRERPRRPQRRGPG